MTDLSPAQVESTNGLWLGRAISIAAFVYVVARAVRLPISHDEAITYLDHVLGSLGDVFAYGGFYPSNNHLLNTLLIKVLVAALGPFELAIRFPAIVGFCLYLVGVDRLVRLLPTSGYRTLGVLLLLGQPFLLEFFALARGYALGLGFMALGMASLWQHLGRGESTAIGWGVLRTTFFFAMSVLANLTFIPVFAAALGVVFVADWIREDGLRTTIVSATPSVLIVTIMAAIPLLEMRAEGELYAGGDSGLWSDTIMSLARATLYGRWSDSLLLPTLVAVLALFILGWSLTVLILALKRGFASDPKVRALAGTLGILAVSLVWLEAQHHLLGVNYPVARMTIYLLPLVPMVALLAGSIQRGRFSDLILPMLAVVFLLHAGGSLNLSRHYEWWYDSSTPEMLSFVEGRIAGGPALQGPLSLGIHWQLEPGINFYLHQKRLGWMAPVSRRGPGGEHDYYYLFAADRKFIEEHQLQILRHYPESATVLAIPPS